MASACGQENPEKSALIETMSKRSVVIIDDDGDIRSFLRVIINAGDYIVMGEGGSIAAAKSILSERVPHILLLDINLEGGSGLDVLEYLHKQYPDTKIIMISGDATSDNVKKALTQGAAGFIAKPFKHETVIQALDRV